MAEKPTTMVLKVDLHCPCCYKKIKKILAKFHEIRSQRYDEKQNTVTITVVCCNPEKFRDKLCCKGGKTIKWIEIKEPPKPEEKKPEEKKPEKPPPPPNEPEEKIRKKTPVPEPVIGYPPTYPVPVCCGPCYEGNPGGPCYHGYGRPVPIPLLVPIIPKWVLAPGRPPVNPVRDCCGPCSEGNPGGPCYHGYAPGRPPVSQVRDCCGPCSEGNPGGPCYHGYEPEHSPVNPVRDCCGPCSEGNPGGPCYHGHGRPEPCYDGSWYASGSGGCTPM